MNAISNERLEALAAKGRARIKPAQPFISVGLGTCGIGNGADKLFEALAAEIKKRGAKIALRRVGCFGFCAEEPLLMLRRPGEPVLLFSKVEASKAARFVDAALDADKAAKLAHAARGKIEEWDFKTSKLEFGKGYPKVPSWDEIPFFKGQEKIILRDSGLIDPESIEEYAGAGGYLGLARALSGMSPEQVVKEVLDSGLRGRGGAGFPTGRKWELMRIQPGPVKYVICNADEGDPGAYMNRNEIESDPHMLVEGMAIGAYAMGASRGIVYVRAEYPLAVERFKKAVEAARAAGFLGNSVMGSGFSFDIDIVMGAGAFVCGEETALIASAEGRSGRPMPRPPFPAQKGYQGAPTNINNVETWCAVPAIMARGAAWYAGVGVPGASGTKVFSLVGKAKNTGLVELPLGSPLESIVYGMGEGAGGKRILAVQTGGPSGGCIPAELFDAKVDYESLAAIGAIMGSGGMVVMDQDNCMVDVARYFVSFTAAESCGKCASCREGLSQMLRILDSVTKGEASMADLDELERIALVVKDSALCGLGQTAANPVLTTLKYFREEYEAHILEKRCRAGVCESLFEALCENSCPMHVNIPGYLALLKEQRIEDAFELTLRDNPLPGTIGRICHFHCQMRCRRETLDEPVAQGEIHRYLADTMYKMGREKDVWKRLVAEKAAPTGKKVAIVGAGPAGLAASFYLSRLGHEVTVFDSHAKAGGILRYGIPAYRLPREVLDKELELWKKLGVRFIFNTEVGKDASLPSLAAQYDAVLMATGAQADRKLGVPGEGLKGVHPGYEWLEAFQLGKAPEPGRRVLILGGGNVAIDAARTLFRLNREVTVAYRRTRAELPANAHELKGAEEEGIRFEYMLSPEEILGDAKGRVRAVRFRVMKAGPLDKSGRPSPVPTDRTMEIACDELIVAVGEKVDSAWLAKDGVSAEKDGRVKIEPFTMRAGLPNVYAAGDVVSGPATAAEAMGLAKDAARAIDRALTGLERFASLYRDFGYSMELPLDTPKSRMNRSREVPPEQRRGNFQEISLGYSGEQALCEAARCLRCDVRSNARSPWR
jgi:NADH-quinone oxidoreductase subunit F